MDRRDTKEVALNKQVFGPQVEASETQEGEMSWVEESGKLYRMPYKMIKQVVFSELDKNELKDIPYSARLQYRLLLMEPVLKAKVAFHKRFIRIIYNPTGADNIKPKISREQLIKFLADEGVHVRQDKIEERDYDYYKEFYQYAYFPKSIREAPPYGWTKEEWQKQKEKLAKQQYRKEHPTVLDRIRTALKPKDHATS
jgi:hypothetical protein